MKLRYRILSHPIYVNMSKPKKTQHTSTDKASWRPVQRHWKSGHRQIIPRNNQAGGTSQNPNLTPLERWLSADQKDGPWDNVGAVKAPADGVGAGDRVGTSQGTEHISGTSVAGNAESC